MKKISMNIIEMIKAHNALCDILEMHGLDRKKVYWLNRIKNSLQSFMNIWYKHYVPKFQKENMSEENIVSYVPADHYEQFKNELIMASGIEEEMDAVFNKYEIASMMMNKKEMELALFKAGQEFVNEIEFHPIEIDQALNHAIQRLTGAQQVSIAFLFKEESPIKLAPSGLIS